LRLLQHPFSSTGSNIFPQNFPLKECKKILTAVTHSSRQGMEVKNPGIHWLGGWMGPRGGLNVLVKSKHLVDKKCF
jgi:hypothetical protein